MQEYSLNSDLGPDTFDEMQGKDIEAYSESSSVGAELLDDELARLCGARTLVVSSHLPERIEHLERIRQLQDETGGFTAFICWSFQPDHTEMSDIRPTGSYDYLRTQAVARLYLDNVPSIQSSWVTQGLKIGQLAMLYGANDMGSLMIEENVVAEAGTVHYLTLDQIRGAITELGYEPRQRNVFYELMDMDHQQRAVEANREWVKRREADRPLVSLA